MSTYFDLFNTKCGRHQRKAVLKAKVIKRKRNAKKVTRKLSVVASSLSFATVFPQKHMRSNNSQLNVTPTKKGQLKPELY